MGLSGGGVCGSEEVLDPRPVPPPTRPPSLLKIIRVQTLPAYRKVCANKTKATTAQNQTNQPSLHSENGYLYGEQKP